MWFPRTCSCWGSSVDSVASVDLQAGSRNDLRIVCGEKQFPNVPSFFYKRYREQPFQIFQVFLTGGLKMLVCRRVNKQFASHQPPRPRLSQKYKYVEKVAKIKIAKKLWTTVGIGPTKAKRLRIKIPKGYFFHRRVIKEGGVSECGITSRNYAAANYTNWGWKQLFDFKLI